MSNATVTFYARNDRDRDTGQYTSVTIDVEDIIHVTRCSGVATYVVIKTLNDVDYSLDWRHRSQWKAYGETKILVLGSLDDVKAHVARVAKANGIVLPFVT